MFQKREVYGGRGTMGVESFIGGGGNYGGGELYGGGGGIMGVESFMGKVHGRLRD